MRPWNNASSLRLTRLIAWAALALNVGALVLTMRYLSNLEFHIEGELLRLLGWGKESSIMQYRDLFFWLTDFVSRSVILTVAIADLLVAATVAMEKKSAEESDWLG